MGIFNDLYRNILNNIIELDENTLLEFVKDFNKSIISNDVDIYERADLLVYCFNRCYTKEILKELCICRYKFKTINQNMYNENEDKFIEGILNSKLFNNIKELSLIYSLSKDFEFYKKIIYKFVYYYLIELGNNSDNINFIEVKQCIELLKSLADERYNESIQHLETYYLNYKINNVNEKLNIEI